MLTDRSEVVCVRNPISSEERSPSILQLIFFAWRSQHEALHCEKTSVGLLFLGIPVWLGIVISLTNASRSD
ncbi:MAG: hypothetical protein EBV06_00010 [Planctomycetia bacterium]|nr:hypothetical protein [Planctomycetia bacterium]